MKTQPKKNINMSDEDQQRLDAYKVDVSDDADAMDDQREQANSDMRFVNVDGGMWEGFYEKTFNSAERVKLELDIVSNPLQRFIGEWNQNRVGVRYEPSDSGTTTKDSELLNGIYRSEFRDYSGGTSTDNAVIECATCGFGSFILANQFDDEGDPENENQHIEWRPIYNAYNTVIWDQGALRIDKRDAGHCTVLKQYTKKSFEKAYPERDATSAYVPDHNFQYRGDNLDTEMIYIATRYEVVKKTTPVFVYNNLVTEKLETYAKDEHEKIKAELKADESRVFVRERKVVHQICEKTVFSGTEILEDTRRIAGKHIPVISLYGYRAFVDGTERYRGIVRKLKSGQQLFNVQVSQLAENAATSGQEVPIFLREQVASPDVAEAWADKNNKPYLVVDAVKDDDGNTIAAGPIGYSKPPALDQSTTALLSIVPNYIKDVSGFEVGEAIKKETSGKALRAMIKRENMNTQVINDNIANAIAWSGEVFQAMAQDIYTTARMVRTLARDGEEGNQNLLAPVMDTETGQVVESNDLRNKKFKSYADVGPQYDSVREETVDDMKGMAELLEGTEYMPLIIATMMENTVGVGLDPLKKFNREKMLTMGMIEPTTDEDIKFVEQAAQNQQPDPQQALMAAATQQQEAEARNLDAASAEKVARKGLLEAQTAETVAGIQMDQQKLQATTQNDANKLLLEARKQAREQLANLPIEGTRVQ